MALKTADFYKKRVEQKRETRDLNRNSYISSKQKHILDIIEDKVEKEIENLSQKCSINLSVLEKVTNEDLSIPKENNVEYYVTRNNTSKFVNERESVGNSRLFDKSNDLEDLLWYLSENKF